MRDPDELRRLPAEILDAVSAVVIGKEEAKRLFLVALLSGGHVLIEGLPGTAKTLLGKVFAQAIRGQFKRIQLTPDLVPADVTGFHLYKPDGSSTFVRGPVFANLVLADELNRTTPRTQAAFLEAMAEHQVTIEGERHPLPLPFMLIASQQPFGGEGTYPLAGVQTDRFAFRAWSDHPERSEEVAVIGRIDDLEDPHVQPAVTPDEVLALRKAIQGVHVGSEVKSYIVELVDRLRRHPDLSMGPSPRGSIALYKGSRVLALLDGRHYTVPDDVKALAVPALVHRIRLRTEVELDGVAPESVVQRAVEQTAVPKFVG
jgi:MoxR-like ATPase